MGECLPNEDYSPGPPAVGVVAVITELGHPVDMIEILQMDFESRLKVGSNHQHLKKNIMYLGKADLICHEINNKNYPATSYCTYILFHSSASI